MKKLMKSGLCLLALVAMFSGCISEEIAPQEKNDSELLQLNYNIAGSSPESLATRAVPGTIAENTVNNLMVLFFAPTTDGSGTYIGYATSVTSDDPATASGTSRISMPAGQEVENAYSFIILSNYARYLRQGSSSNLDEFLTNTLTGKTQKEARTLMKGYADAPTGIKATDGLPMSCEYNKAAGTNLLYISLKRAVARVDLVSSAPTTNFILKSAQIWNVRKSATAIGSNGYGIESDYTHYRDRVIETDNGRVEGGLYAFENNTLTSDANDATTTCLIVGGYYNNSTTLSYYRINVVAPGLNQTMGRNHLYTINIKSVAGEGKDNPDDAYSYNKNVIKYEINDWDDSFNGMYAFDADGNGLAVSTRNVTFANTGGKIDIDVYRIDSPDPTKRITDTWNVAMSAELQGSSFLVSKITGQERFNLSAPGENMTSNNRQGIANVTWGRISLPVNVLQLNIQSQLYGLKIVPTYLRYPAAEGSKKMTISLEGSFSGVAESDLTPVIVYETAGESWLTVTYDPAASSPTKGIFVYNVLCQEMPTGKEYRTADLKVALVQGDKTLTGTVNATQARSYNPGDDGYIRKMNVMMLERQGTGGSTYINVGTTTDRYKKFEGLPADKKTAKDLHFHIVENAARKYQITLESSMDWRIISPGMSANLHYKVTEKNMGTGVTTILSDNVGSTGIFYKGSKNSTFAIEVKTVEDVVTGWSDSFYIEYENGDTEVFRTHQQGVISTIGPNIAPKDGVAIDPATLFYYETFTMNNIVWLDRNLGAKSNGHFTNAATSYPIDNDAKGAYFPLSSSSTACPAGFRTPMINGGGEWEYVKGAVVWTGDSTSDPVIPYERIFHTVYQMNPEKRFLVPVCGNASNPTAAIAYYLNNSTSILCFNADNGTTSTVNYSTTEGYSIRCVRK